MGNTEYKDRIVHELDNLNREQQKMMLDYLLRKAVKRSMQMAGKYALDTNIIIRLFAGDQAIIGWLAGVSEIYVR